MERRRIVALELRLRSAIGGAICENGFAAFVSEDEYGVGVYVAEGLILHVILGEEEHAIRAVPRRAKDWSSRNMSGAPGKKEPNQRLPSWPLRRRVRRRCSSSAWSRFRIFR